MTKKKKLRLLGLENTKGEIICLHIDVIRRQEMNYSQSSQWIGRKIAFDPHGMGKKVKDL